MHPAATQHANDEVLERYAMGRLGAPELEEFECHLLICANCREGLESTALYVTAMRSAARELRRRAAASTPFYRRFLAAPAPVCIAAMAASVVLIVAGDYWRPLRRAEEPPPVLVLESSRGADTPADSGTRAGKPFVLMLDLTGLQLLPQYCLEVVDTHANIVYQAKPAPSQNKVRATVAEGLSSGDYYVRLYDQNRELLREYGLKVVN
jgi:hypothetical protein